MTVKLKTIKGRKEYQASLDRVDTMFDNLVKPTSPEGETLQVVLLLIKSYEDKHFPILTPRPY
ncbi:MAG TPA: hypothetical protein VK517_02030 [Cyclobacteriaceae bacterium]|nr:hypothetical protein [Cyclobacteriaceae bacterium]